MNEEELKQLFQNSHTLAASSEAKKRAIAAAVAEFETQPEPSEKNIFQFLQGIFSSLRLTGDFTKQPEDKAMTKINPPWIFGGLATTVVGVFAFIMIDVEPPKPIGYEEPTSYIGETENTAGPSVNRQEAPVAKVDAEPLHDEGPRELTAVAEEPMPFSAPTPHVSDELTPIVRVENTVISSARAEVDAPNTVSESKPVAPLAVNKKESHPAKSEVGEKPSLGTGSESTAASLGQSEEVIVSGFRGSLSGSQAAKRTSDNVIDSIRADDIGPSTGHSVTENLARATGVSIEEDVIVTSAKATPSRHRQKGGKVGTRKRPKPQVHSPSEIKSRPAIADTNPPNDQQEYRDNFEHFDINRIKRVAEEPVSTFSIDVDTASYSFVRRELGRGRLPQKSAVRIEEMINYFNYDYPLPKNKKEPFKSSVLVSDSPWGKGKKLLHIGIKGYDIDPDKQPRSNLVFLLDVSGSMRSPDKLPLVKQSMGLLLSQLRPDDTVAIVVYAGAAGTVLAPTKVKEKQKILSALKRLNAGGSTAGAQGIKLAYQLAEANADKKAVNRIILATDGDFNVGITNSVRLKDFVERKRQQGIYLSVLGFGQGNYQDHLMQTLAQNGNGIAAYIDTLSEAQKVLVDEATSSLFPIAKDVKIQVEFNPATVSEYRLVGYETRALKREDFNNDKVDAGDIGAGHTVTAIYEFTPRGADVDAVDALRYSEKEPKPGAEVDQEYAFLKIRYKLPKASASRLLQTPITRGMRPAAEHLVREFSFATSVAGFAQLLKNDKYLGRWGYNDALELAQSNRGADLFGYRAEFVQLIRRAQVASEM